MSRGRRAAWGAAVATLALAPAAAPAPAAAAAAVPLTLVPVARFDTPVGVTAAPGDASRVFVTEKGGRVRVRHGGTTSTFVDLTDRVKADGYEQGLLGLAFAADYAASGRLYVFYTAPAPGAVNGGSDLVVAELRRADADHADPASERVLLRIPHRLEEFENGGQLRVTPDGLLWIGTGDGGGDDDPHRNAQRLDPATDDAAQGADALLGKLLRIDPRPGDGCGGACTIPSDNPGFAQREVWAYGLRNPWRFSFDRLTGDLAIADVGNHAFEEIDAAPAPGLGRGANYGWPFFEGTAAVTGTGTPAPGCCTPPVLQRSHGAPDGYDAIIGGVVVRQAELPSVDGRYLYASLGSGAIRSVRLVGGGASDDRDTGLAAPGLTSFGEDACGGVYLTTYSGVLYRLSQGAGVCGAVGVRLAAPARQRLASGRVRVTVACVEGCVLRLRATLRVGGATVGHSAPRSVRLAPHGDADLSVRVSARLRRTLARALAGGRTVTARVVATARPAPGADGGARPAGRASAISRLVR